MFFLPRIPRTTNLPSGHGPENGQTMTNGKSRKYNKSRFWLGNGNPRGTYISRVLGFRVLVNFYPRPRVCMCMRFPVCVCVCVCVQNPISVTKTR